jgi:hypothetical protein
VQEWLLQWLLPLLAVPVRWHPAQQRGRRGQVAGWPPPLV